jgi:hypothetical protein
MQVANVYSFFLIRRGIKKQKKKKKQRERERERERETGIGQVIGLALSRAERGTIIKSTSGPAGQACRLISTTVVIRSFRCIIRCEIARHCVWRITCYRAVSAHNITRMISSGFMLSRCGTDR